MKFGELGKSGEFAIDLAFDAAQYLDEDGCRDIPALGKTCKGNRAPPASRFANPSTCRSGWTTVQSRTLQNILPFIGTCRCNVSGECRGQKDPINITPAALAALIHAMTPASMPPKTMPWHRAVDTAFITESTVAFQEGPDVCPTSASSFRAS